MITRGVAMATGSSSPAAPVQWFPGLAWLQAGANGERALSAYRYLGRAGSAIHVLMIEDDPSIAEMYRFQLEHDGYQVTIATTGEVAVSTMTDSAPDVVLLDLLLPDRSGFEVLSALNERFPNHPPVVILSNYGEPSMMDRGRSLGAIEYLVKSRVTPAEISRQIPLWAKKTRGGGQAQA